MVYDEQTDQQLTLLTDDFDWVAETVSKLYKARWDVEVFFNHLKQLFRIMAFVGTSDNTERILVWCSLMAMVLLRYPKKYARYNWHMFILIVSLRLYLFVKRDHDEWVYNPIYKVVPPPQRTLFDTG